MIPARSACAVPGSRVARSIARFRQVSAAGPVSVNAAAISSATNSLGWSRVAGCRGGPVLGAAAGELRGHRQRPGRGPATRPAATRAGPRSAHRRPDPRAGPGRSRCQPARPAPGPGRPGHPPTRTPTATGRSAPPPACPAPGRAPGGLPAGARHQRRSGARNLSPAPPRRCSPPAPPGHRRPIQRLTRRIRRRRVLQIILINQLVPFPPRTRLTAGSGGSRGAHRPARTAGVRTGPAWSSWARTGLTRGGRTWGGIDGCRGRALTRPGPVLLPSATTTFGWRMLSVLVRI